MRYYIVISLLLLLLLSSCRVGKDIYFMDSDEVELSGFYVSGDCIYQDGVLVGEFTEVEWELYKELMDEYGFSEANFELV